MQSRVTSYAARRFGRFGSCTIWWALSKICCICFTASCNFSASCMTSQAKIDVIPVSCACPQEQYKLEIRIPSSRSDWSSEQQKIQHHKHIPLGYFHGTRQSQPTSGTAIRICFKFCAISFTFLGFATIFCTSGFMHTSYAISPCAKTQRPLSDRAGMLPVSVRAYLGLLQLVLNLRHRLQEIGRANRLCTAVAVQDGTEVAKLDRTLGLRFIARTRPKPCAKYYRAGPLGYYPNDNGRLRHNVSPKQHA